MVSKDAVRRGSRRLANRISLTANWPIPGKTSVSQIGGPSKSGWAAVAFVFQQAGTLGARPPDCGRVAEPGSLKEANYCVPLKPKDNAPGRTLSFGEIYGNPKRQ